MSSITRRKEAFIKLGEYFRLFSDSLTMNEKLSNLIENLHPIKKDKFWSIHKQIEEYIEFSTHYNPWFTKINLLKAIQSIGESLTSAKINKWLEKYENEINNISSTKTIGVVMAGNIPLVGFLDYLCVLITGNCILTKLSKNDNKLLPLFHEILVSFEGEFENKAIFTQGTLMNFEAIIATGSDNTARTFEYYFGKYPNIIRKNRNGVAVLKGEETQKELESLADDIFMYFGLGCRNVSKLFVPENYNFEKLFPAFNKYAHLTDHHKYANNYDYNKSIFLINKIKHFDNGFVLLKEEFLFASPISVLYYEYYHSKEDLIQKLETNRDKIQCLLSTESFKNIPYFPFGKAQQPELWHYADGIDTMEFLINLEN